MYIPLRIYILSYVAISVCIHNTCIYSPWPGPPHRSQRPAGQARSYIYILARRRERMMLHALAIQIRAELRVRLSLNAASSRLTPLASGELARVFFCDDVHRKLFIHTFLQIIFGIFRPIRSDATRAAGRSASGRRWCACF